MTEPRPPLSGLAVTSFAFGLLSCIPLMPVVAVTVSVIALIRRGGRRGRGLAVAGLALGLVWLAGYGILVAVVRQPHEPTEAERKAGVTIGTCLQQVIPEPADYVFVPCDQLHRGEVFAVFELPDGPFPGQERVNDEASRGCRDRLSGYSFTTRRGRDVDIAVKPPGTANWPTYRAVICIAYTDQARSESIHRWPWYWPW